MLEVFSLTSETAHTSSTSDGGSVDATSVSSTFPVTGSLTGDEDSLPVGDDDVHALVS